MLLFVIFVEHVNVLSMLSPNEEFCVASYNQWRRTPWGWFLLFLVLQQNCIWSSSCIALSCFILWHCIFVVDESACLSACLWKCAIWQSKIMRCMCWWVVSNFHTWFAQFMVEFCFLLLLYLEKNGVLVRFRLAGVRAGHTWPGGLFSVSKSIHLVIE